MQGGNVAGGLGLDKEFFESILVPQVMIYGFLGLRPTPEGFSLAPQLPKAWPALTISRIHLHDHVLEVTVKGQTVTVKGGNPRGEPLAASLPQGWKLENASACRITAGD